MNMRVVVLVLAVSAQDVSAQSLESRIVTLRGSIGFEYDTKRYVCGNGESITISHDTSPGWTTRSRRSGVHMGRGVSGGMCEEGPARVVLTRSGNAITDVRITVGSRDARVGTDLGTVSAAEAARFLLTVAPNVTGRSAEHAIMGAAIADAPSPWRRMLEIARDGGASDAARKASLFWVSQEASAVATTGLGDVAMDDANGSAVQGDALFYLAQRKDGAGIPALIRVVRESKSAKLRKDAIFFLSQSGDPRALDLFEKLLAGR